MWESGSIIPGTVKPITGWRWAVSFRPSLFYPQDPLETGQAPETVTTFWRKEKPLPVAEKISMNPCPNHSLVTIQTMPPSSLMLVPVPIQVANMAGCELHCNPMTTLTSHWDPFPFPHFTWAQCSAVNKAPSRNVLCNSSSVSQASLTSLKEKFMLKLSSP